MTSSIFQENHFKSFLSKLKFYDKQYPKKNEYVLAKITRYEEHGIYCYLNEYKCEALLSFKDASSSKKLKNIKKQVKKGRTYILTVYDVNDEKGFIDVEKRSIDEEEELEFTKLINFYEKIFNIFVKEYFKINPKCEKEDVYEFLKNTLWKEDPKLIEKNLKDIHIDSEKVIELYNLNYIKTNLLQELLLNIPKPGYKHGICIDVKSFSLNAVNDIIEYIKQLGNEINTEFRNYSIPLYYSSIKTEYDPKFNPDEYKKSLQDKINNFIKSNPKDKLIASLKDVSYKLV